MSTLPQISLQRSAVSLQLSILDHGLIAET